MNPGTREEQWPQKLDIIQNPGSVGMSWATANVPGKAPIQNPVRLRTYLPESAPNVLTLEEARLVVNNLAVINNSLEKLQPLTQRLSAWADGPQREAPDGAIVTRGHHDDLVWPGAEEGAENEYEERDYDDGNT